MTQVGVLVTDLTRMRFGVPRSASPSPVRLSHRSPRKQSTFGVYSDDSDDDDSHYASTSDDDDDDSGLDSEIGSSDDDSFFDVARTHSQASLRRAFVFFFFFRRLTFKKDTGCLVGARRDRRRWKRRSPPYDCARAIVICTKSGSGRRVTTPSYVSQLPLP